MPTVIYEKGSLRKFLTGILGIAAFGQLDHCALNFSQTHAALNSANTVFNHQRAEQSGAEQSRAEQSGAEQSRAEPVTK